MNTIIVRNITRRSGLPLIAEAWEQLYLHQQDRSPFLHWIWFDTFWAEMDTRGWEITLLTAWDEDTLVGVAPLMIQNAARMGIQCKVCRGLENAHTELYQWLLSPETKTAEQTAGLFVEEIGKLVSGLHLITWGNMPLDHPVSQILCRVLGAARYRVTLRRPRLAPVVFFSETNDFFASLQPSLRSRLKNRWNRLEKMGKIRFEALSASADLENHLETAWNLEAASWKGKAKTSIAQNARLKNFYNQLAVRLEPLNKMVLFLLWCDDTLVAFNYCLLDNGMIHLLKLSFNDTYARTSPSYLLNWKVAEWSKNKGLSRFYLGGKPDEWKLHWTTQTNTFVTLFAFSPGIAGLIMYFLRFGWKDVLKKIPLTQRIKHFSDQRKWLKKRYSAGK